VLLFWGYAEPAREDDDAGSLERTG